MPASKSTLTTKLRDLELEYDAVRCSGFDEDELEEEFALLDRKVARVKAAIAAEKAAMFAFYRHGVPAND